MNFYTGIVAVLFLLAQSSWARPVLYTDEDVARRADVVAIVHISTAGAARSPYILATVTRTIRGKLSSSIQLPVGRSMECNYGFELTDSGDYLILMEKVNGKLVRAHCGRAWHPIVDGRISWHWDPHKNKKGTLIDLEVAIKDIESLGVK